MPKPRQMRERAGLTPKQIAAASYVGSPEHKAKRWWGGLPGARTSLGGVARRPKKVHTTICPKTTKRDRDEATLWVREALTAGHYRYCDGDKTYPKHIWHRDDERQFWSGFSVNQEAGTYKGWPISEEEKRALFD